ncbi:MAG: phasin family protein [Clostridiales bacterium]|jgi:polyhydroxyalkanoate synthesis regulator phasin|nr:phasin family protein [Clostridiales bacterium]
MDQITSGLRKLILAGIGAAAIAKEKGGEVLDALSKRGEVTVEQGRVLNEELKRNLKENVRENVETVKQSVKDNVRVHVIYPEDDLMNAVDGMDEEQLAALKERIAARKQAAEEKEAPETEAETEAKDEDEKDGSAE